MRPVDRPSAGDRGFSLVEQLVVMVVFGIISALVAGTIIQMSLSAEDHRQRVETLSDTQLALEKVTRDLRAADPVLSFTALQCEPGRVTTASPAPTSCANDITFERIKDGKRWRIHYTLGAGELREGREFWTGSGWSTKVWTVLARRLQNGLAPQSPLFALTDLGGQPVTLVGDVSRINALLVSTSTRRRPNPLPVTAEVTVRNRVYRAVS